MVKSEVRNMIETHGSNTTSAHYSRLGQTECEKLHMASLEVLETIGLEVHYDKARDLLIQAGATADGQRVRIPEHMVTKALASAPKKMILFDRKGKPAIRAWGYNSYFGGGSDCLNVLDHRTGERRRAVLQDVIEATRLMDALPQVDFIMSAFLPSDVSEPVYPQFQMEVMLTKSTKPIVFVTPDFETCVACVEMAEIAAGGVEAFRARPFAVCYINVTSGMVANQDSLKKCIYFAEKGLPQLYIPLNAAGVNSPATTAGCMATMNAECRDLAGCCSFAIGARRFSDRGTGLEWWSVQLANHGGKLLPARRARGGGFDGQVLPAAGIWAGWFNRFESIGPAGRRGMCIGTGILAPEWRQHYPRPGIYGCRAAGFAPIDGHGQRPVACWDGSGRLQLAWW